MKKIKLFILPDCPYCVDALAIIETLLQNKLYSRMVIDVIDESQNMAFAEQYDYYYVPTIYVDEKKMADGVMDEKMIKGIFDYCVK